MTTGRTITKANYDYLLELPLVLHLPSLHAAIVHAGLLPHDPLKDPSDASQPLMSTTTAATAADIARFSEEISILTNIPQNQDPWTLLNMRSIYQQGKHQGEVTKSSKKGTPWSKVWKKEMARCQGPGSWTGGDTVESAVEEEDEEDTTVEGEEDTEEDELKGEKGRLSGTRRKKGDGELSKLDCSPMTVIYGHAGECGQRSRMRVGDVSLKRNSGTGTGRQAVQQRP